MERKKILLVIEGGYPWYRGGVSEWVHQLLQYSEKNEFAIVQIVSRHFAEERLSTALYDIPVNVTSFTRILSPDIRHDWEIETNRWLADVRQDVKPIFDFCDVVHITNTGFAGWLGMKMALAHDKPLVLTEHALYWKEVEIGATALESGIRIPDSIDMKSLFVEMLGAMARQIYEAADQVISVSQCNIPFQKIYGAKEVAYIPNGISKEWLLSTDKKRKNQLTIGWAGRCAQIKNPMKFIDLIDAFEESRERDISFLMLSCDASEPDLEYKLKVKSENYPQLKLIWNRSVEEFIDQMDALCITSLNESQPLVLFEALARKVLPVGWQAGDADSKYGFFVSPDTPANQLMKQLLAKWQISEEWNREIYHKYDLVCRNHLWENIFKRYHRVYDVIMKERAYVQ